MKFGNLYAIPSRNGLTKPRSVRGDGIKFVNMGELFENERIGNIEMDRVPVSKTEMRDALLQEDDLLFARQSLVREGAGKCSIIAEVEEPTTFDSHLIRVRLNRSIANPNFYRYYFASPLSPMPGIVSQCAQAGIKGSDLKNLDVDCPPLEVQDKIASILGTYDELIENSRRQIKLLEEAARRLYREWFIDLKFPGHETTPIVDGLPEGWGRGTLLDLADTVRGCSYSSDEIMRGEKTLINLGNLTPFGGFRSGYEKPFSGKSREDQMVAKGDVVMGLTEQAIGLAGYAALLPTVPDGSVISADLVKIVPKEGVPAEFVYAILRYGRLSELISPLANGTKIKHLRPQSLSRVTTQIPSIELMQRYAVMVRPVYEQIDVCYQQIAVAREARDRLLPKLMSGEIEV